MKLLRYILFEKYYIYISALEVASPGNRHCANCIGTLSFAMCREQCEGSMGGRFRYWSHDGRSGGRLTRPMSIRPTDVSVLASIHRQWRSRDLEVRGAQGVCGTEVTQRGPGAEQSPPKAHSILGRDIWLPNHAQFCVFS